MKYWIILPVLLVLFSAGCRRDIQPGAKNTIAVTNSYFECAVGDLCPDIPILCLTPPGMCPGHFDMLPSAAQQLRQCRLILRFDFQSGMDAQMRRFTDNGLEIREIKSGPGMCIPATYMEVCEQICRVIAAAFPDRRQSLQDRLAEIRQRMTGLQEKIRIDGAESVDVICSAHQAEFAQHLGLNVISTFPGRDLATPANIGQCLEDARGKPIQFVIANQQEGTELAEILADRMHARMVIFTNFPDTSDVNMNFDKMVLENIRPFQKNIVP